MDTSSVRRLPFLVVLCAAASILVACSAVLGPGGATASLTVTTDVTTDVTSAPEAAAAVAARSPLFDGIGPQDPDVIGASAWWTATPSGSATPPSAWTIVFEVGWGDCQAGC